MNIVTLLVIIGYIGLSHGSAMDLLEPHITSGLGVSFKGDNNNFWSVIGRSGGRRDVESAKSYKDFWTKFTIEKADDNHIYLKAADGRYLTRMHRGGIDYIEAAKYHRDVFCKFEIYEVDGKIVFKADNGKFLSRVYRDGEHNIEAEKWSIDPFTKFIVETGSLIPVQEEIESITWGDAVVPTSVAPTMLGSYTQANGGSQSIEKKFTFDKSIETTQSTNWEHSWGVTAGISYTTEAGVNVGAASAKTSLTLSAEVRYDGKKGGNEGKKDVMKLVDQTTVLIPSGKYVTVKFMVTKVDNAEVPFTAVIRRSSEVGVTRITQKGIWKGVLVYNSHIQVDERKI